MRKLILIDRKFPYKTGEAFLENEINEIAKRFDEIYIFPIDVCEKEQQTRKITANNVKVIPTGKKSYQRSKLKFILKSVRYIFDKSNEGKNVKEKLYDAYYLAICNRKSIEIIEKIKKIHFDDEDEVYIYAYWFYTPASIALTVKKYFYSINHKSIAISRAHRFDIYLDNTKNNYLPQRNELVKNIDRVYACSNNGTTYLKDEFEEYNYKFFDGYLGTYDHGLNKKKNNDIIQIVSCSRVSEIKRVDLIEKALENVEKIYSGNKKIVWTHIGDGKLLKSIRERSKANLTKIRTNFLGAIDNSEVYEFYRKNQVDLFINVSSSEGLPVSIMEAISFGIPVIATDVGGTSEIVFNEYNGFLLNKEFSIEELSRKIIFLMENNDSYRKNSRLYWEEHYNAIIN